MVIMVTTHDLKKMIKMMMIKMMTVTIAFMMATKTKIKKIIIHVDDIR